ncbi:MAG: hypothetical protein E7207_01580 [Clostridium butyricum]|nr:hypothetical protein [Clostridium butyricum]
MDNRLNYNEIINYMKRYYDVPDKELTELLDRKENNYILLLLLKKHDCLNAENLKNKFKIEERRKIKNSLQKAEEMFLLNSFFRKKYFRMENYIEKNNTNPKKTLDNNNNV